MQQFRATSGVELIHPEQIAIHLTNRRTLAMIDLYRFAQMTGTHSYRIGSDGRHKLMRAPSRQLSLYTALSAITGCNPAQ